MSIEKRTRICLLCAVAVMVVALIMTLFGADLGLGLDYAGGYNFRFNLNQAAQEADVATIARSQGLGGAAIAFSGEGNETVEIRSATPANEEDAKALLGGLQAALAEKYPELSPDTASVSYVGPSQDGSLAGNAWLIGLIAALLLGVYTLARFGWNTALAAVAGFVLDVLLVLALSVLLRWMLPVNAPFVYAMVVVAGYSINNIVTLFDRIRVDSRRKDYGKLPKAELVTVSCKEGLGRNVITGLGALLITALLCILGVASIRAFALPILLGVLVSTCSSYFITGYLWALLEGNPKNRPSKAKVKTKKA